MKTLNELKHFCEKNNVRYELSPLYSVERIYSYTTGNFEHIQIGWQFGMNNIGGTKKSASQWIWFRNYDDVAEGESKFWFYQRFSCTNGKAYKGAAEMWKCLNIIERRS